MKDMRKASKENWNSDDSLKDINAGSFQRIADAVEKLVISLEKIAVNTNVDVLLHRIAGLRGYIKRMKKKIK